MYDAKKLRSVETSRGSPEIPERRGNEDWREGSLSHNRKGKRDLVFYRRIERKLTGNEMESLQKYARKIDMVYDFTLSNSIIKMKVPEFQGKLYNEMNNIPGCRVSPVTFQRSGDVYISIEYAGNMAEKVSDKIMDYVNASYPYERSVIYMGSQSGKMPYLLNLYSSLGNSLHDLTLIRTRWSFKGNEAALENEGIFQNTGEFLPKQFVDDEADGLIWRLNSKEIRGRSPSIIVDEDNSIVEMNVRSGFFSDFYRNVIKEYCGAVFSSYKCDENGLTSHYIVEKRAQQTFLRGLQRHWNLEARKRHANQLLEASDFGLYENVAYTASCSRIDDSVILSRLNGISKLTSGSPVFKVKICHE